MPSEIRSIIFSREELVTALTEFAKRKGRPLPPGSVFKCKVSAEPGVEVALAIAVDGEDRLEHVTFTAKDLGAALVFYCIQHEIPLPARGATKGLRVYGDSLALIVSINVGSEQLEGFLSMG